MINIQIDEGVAAALNAKAAAQGLTVQAYLEAIAISPTAEAGRMTPDELDRILDGEATISPSPSGSFSRADLYSDHD